MRGRCIVYLTLYQLQTELHIVVQRRVLHRARLASL
jgi:hypothetical protein